jgi:hypothetical protein
MQFVRVGILILLLLAGWVSVRTEPALVGALVGCATGWSGSSLTKTAASSRAS